MSENQPEPIQLPADLALSEMGAEPTLAVSVPPPAPRKPRRWPLIVGGIFFILVLGALGGYLGYRAALVQRAQAYDDQVTKVATEQFMLGVQEQAQKHYDLAIRRYEYVIQLDPNFPGVKDKLAEAMLASVLARTPTATMAVILPTPTIFLTPTPDFRGEEEILNNARALLQNKEWAKALEVLDTLRTKNIQYQPVAVDGLYYIALRNRGMQNINLGRLESGLYDLALTERFGPLDVDANGVRTWARMYLSGASYWGVRWDKVVDIFAQVYPYYPNLRDLLGVTAAERFRKGSINYGDQLAAAEKYCEAYDQYHNAQSVVNDPAVELRMKDAFKICHPATATPSATVSPTATKTVPAGAPTATMAVPTATLETPTATQAVTPSPTPDAAAVTPSPTTAPEATQTPSLTPAAAP